jgi:hypothetical protein
MRSKAVISCILGHCLKPAIGCYSAPRGPQGKGSTSSTEHNSAKVNPGTLDAALLGTIGFEVVTHAVEDWQTGGGRTVWLTRTSRVLARAS